MGVVAEGSGPARPARRLGPVRTLRCLQRVGHPGGPSAALGDLVSGGPRRSGWLASPSAGIRHRKHWPLSGALRLPSQAPWQAPGARRHIRVRPRSGRSPAEYVDNSPKLLVATTIIVGSACVGAKFKRRTVSCFRGTGSKVMANATTSSVEITVSMRDVDRLKTIQAVVDRMLRIGAAAQRLGLGRRRLGPWPGLA